MTPDARLRGGRGQALAGGIALLLAAILWFGALAPARDWFRDRNARLDQRQALLAQMQATVRGLPQLRQAARMAANADADGERLSGASDAAAAAALQARLQAIAASDGIALSTIETMPPVAAGRWHRIGLRIAFRAPWPQLAGFLNHVEAAQARPCIDDLHLSGGTSAQAVVQASMLACGFRFAAADPGR